MAKYYKISFDMTLAREIVLPLASAFMDRHLDWHNLTRENDQVVTWGVVLGYNWQQRLANALSECGLIDKGGEIKCL